MKKYLNYALLYAGFAMAGGVFYREFTKWKGFSGPTALGKVHAHLFMLGMVVFMLISLFVQVTDCQDQKAFRAFMCVYNIGVPLTAWMLLVRGICQVQGSNLPIGWDHAISGVAGLGHILTGLGLVLLLVALKKSRAHA